jgi:hypothetical protein
MKFAKIVYYAAGTWGVLVLTPMFFLFDWIGRNGPSQITYPQFFYGFLAVAMAWQFAFFVIGSDPGRFRLMMIPSMAEKFGHVMSMSVLYLQARVTTADLVTAAPDLVLGVLFAAAFVKTGARSLLAKR